MCAQYFPQEFWQQFVYDSSLAYGCVYMCASNSGPGQIVHITYIVFGCTVSLSCGIENNVRMCLALICVCVVCGWVMTSRLVVIAMKLKFDKTHCICTHPAQTHMLCVSIFFCSVVFGHNAGYFSCMQFDVIILR